MPRNPSADLAQARWASFDERQRVVRELAGESDPDSILQEAIALYRETADDRVLDWAAAALEWAGEHAWPAYVRLAAAGCPELAHFVFPIAYFRAVPRSDRIQLLQSLARRDDSDLRWRLCEAAQQFAPAEAALVLRVLSEGDDGPASEARGALTEAAE